MNSYKIHQQELSGDLFVFAEPANPEGRSMIFIRRFNQLRKEVKQLRKGLT